VPDQTRTDDRIYRLLIDSITDYAIFMLDPQGIVTTWNPGAARFKGYNEAEIVGQHFSRFYTDEDRSAGLPARALHIAATEGRFEQEGWRVRKDGSRMWAHVVIDPIQDPSGRLLGYAKITRDLSRRKAAQEALNKSEAQFRLLVQGVKDYAIYMLDPDGRVASWNTGAQLFKGYSEQEIVGQHFSRFYTEEDRATGLPLRALATAAAEGRFEQEGWRVRKDGTRFWAHVIVDAIRNEAGDLVGYAKVTRDLTELRNAQLALEEARAAFIQSQKMEAMGQLTGGMAHDFNNLLAVVLGNLDLARKRLPEHDTRLKALIENSIQAALRGSSLTQRMLAFARRQALKSGAVDVPKLVRDMAEMLQRTLGPTIRIDTHFPLGLAPALADANQLELAFLNLAVNARDAMPDGGTVVIGARQQTIASSGPGGLKAGDYLCLTVSDTGEGMDQDTLARAVDPFFTTKGVGRGTGLGLSMIHGFAEQSGGRLVLKSRKGEGTTAEIWLPVAQVERRPLSDPADEIATAVENVPKLTVLVVDDDQLVLSNTAAILEDLGHEVVEATSGDQALRILSRRGRIDLVITDQLMPGMLGTQLAVKLQIERPGLPVILVSGYAELPADADPALVRLSKPFMQDDLARVITSLFASADNRVVRFRPKNRG
jgi:PAS domain S-box-containing protein